MSTFIYNRLTFVYRSILHSIAACHLSHYFPNGLDVPNQISIIDNNMRNNYLFKINPFPYHLCSIFTIVYLNYPMMRRALNAFALLNISSNH